jgi:hypothetical protein
MKPFKLLLTVFFVSVLLKANAQLTLTDVINIGSSVVNTYDINSRSIFNIKDSWQQKGWILSAYHRAPPSIGISNLDVFEFTNNTNPSDLFIITTTHFAVGKQAMRYEVDAFTQNIETYNSWLASIRSHPDFLRTTSLDNIYTQIYDAKQNVGEKQRFIFAIQYKELLNNPISVKINNPVVYMMSFIRPFGL